MKGVNTLGQSPSPEPLFAAHSAAEPRGIDTFRSLHSLGNGTNKLSRSTHSFENNHGENKRVIKGITAYVIKVMVTSTFIAM